MNNTVRFVMDDGNFFKKHLSDHNGKEQFCFALPKKINLTKRKTLYIVKELYFPAPKDLSIQQSAFIAPTKEFQGLVYNQAYAKGLSVIDAHIHWFQKDHANFSFKDTSTGRKNAEFLEKNMPAEVDFGMMVFNEKCSSYSGVIYNKQKKAFEPIQTIEFIKSPIELLHNNELAQNIKPDETYARQTLITGWNQNILSDLKVGVVGAGGLGSLIIQGLACMGVGADKGFIMIADHDSVEQSNLSRIPYATKKSLGKNKALVAKDFIKAKNRKIKVIAIPKSVTDKNVQNRLKECHIIIGAVDSAGARKITSEISFEAGTPYIDSGTEIFLQNNSYEACGQIRTTIPRQGCLHCIQGINVQEAAYDLMSEQSKKHMRKAGYIRGTNETPAPSVIHLNGVIANLALSQFTKLIFGEPIENQKALFYEQQKMTLTPASFKRNEKCPLCGDKPTEEETQKALEELKKNIIQEIDNKNTFPKEMKPLPPRY